MPDINKPQLLRHIARSDLTAIEKRYLEGLTNRDKTAQWDYMDAIEPDEDGNCQAYCTNCHTGDTHAIQHVGDVPYCWKCGARMTGVITSTAMVFVDDAAPIKICDCRGGNTAEKAVAAWNKRASDWIPCSERMPDDDERVLGNITITVNANMMKPKQRTIFAKHDRVLGWTTANGYPIVGKITHWMPLPDSPEEVQHE